MKNKISSFFCTKINILNKYNYEFRYKYSMNHLTNFYCGRELRKGMLKNKKMIEEEAQKSQKPTSVSTSIIIVFELITCKISKSV